MEAHNIRILENGYIGLLVVGIFTGDAQSFTVNVSASLLAAC